jgi:hypothetical protein
MEFQLILQARGQVFAPAHKIARKKKLNAPILVRDMPTIFERRYLLSSGHTGPETRSAKPWSHGQDL